MPEQNKLELRLPSKPELLTESANIARKEIGVTHEEILNGTAEQPTCTVIAYVAMYNALYDSSTYPTVSTGFTRR